MKEFTYLFGLDNAAATWRSDGNNYWPAASFIDADGILRDLKFGEGADRHTESSIRQGPLAAIPVRPDPVAEPDA